MATRRLLCFITTTLLCLTLGRFQCHYIELSYELSPNGKPLLKPSTLRPFKTLLSLDPGALSGMVTAMVLIEVEDSIKHYILNHPECHLQYFGITSVDDFDINLVDYFDCMSGVSAGSWAAMYLATRGGQGASRAVLEDPAIVEKYGSIPVGGAEGLRVFFNEYGSTIYPWHTIDQNAGPPLDPTNPLSPGSTSPLFSLDGLEAALEAFLGNTTLADVDTSLLVPAIDLETGLTVYFVNNAFNSPPTTSSATLIPRTGPRVLAHSDSFLPDVTFDEGKNYYLKDVGAASAAVLAVHPAKRMTQVGNETVEFHLVDGVSANENTDLFGSLFVSSEAHLFGFEELAILSVGNDLPLSNLSILSNAGSIQWSQNLNTVSLLANSGTRLWPALMDYLYYADPTTKPFQYLRVNGVETRLLQPGEGDNPFDPRAVPAFEALGRRIATENRESIDAFVRDFIFGGFS